jgi:hypothetical protein
MRRRGPARNTLTLLLLGGWVVLGQPPSAPAPPSLSGGIVGELTMDEPVRLTLANSSCAVYRLRVSRVHAGEGRALRIVCKALGAGRPGYLALGMGAEYASSGSAVDNSPAALGVDVGSGCWPSSATVSLAGRASGGVWTLPSPGAPFGKVLPYGVAVGGSGERPEDACELVSGNYYVYLKNEGTAPASLSLEAEVQVDQWAACGIGGPPDAEFWGTSLLIGACAVAGCFLVSFLVFRFGCRTEVAWGGSSDDDVEGGYPSPEERRMAEREERARARTLYELEAQANALFSSGACCPRRWLHSVCAVCVREAEREGGCGGEEGAGTAVCSRGGAGWCGTGRPGDAAEQFALAASLEPEGSKERAYLEQLLVQMLEREHDLADARSGGGGGSGGGAQAAPRSDRGGAPARAVSSSTDDELTMMAETEPAAVDDDGIAQPAASGAEAAAAKPSTPPPRDHAPAGAGAHVAPERAPSSSPVSGSAEALASGRWNRTRGTASTMNSPLEARP